jgi:hypothetical protein
MFEKQRAYVDQKLNDPRARFHMIMLSITGLATLISVGVVMIWQDNQHAAMERRAAQDYRETIQEFVLVTMDVPQLILDRHGMVEFENLAAHRIGLRAVGVHILQAFEAQNPAGVQRLIEEPDENQSLRTWISVSGLEGTMRVQPRFVEGVWKFWVILQLTSPEPPDNTSRTSVEFKAMVMEGLERERLPHP